MYAPSFLVKDRGTTAPLTSSSSAAMVAPVDVATPATSAEMLTTFFVKLNNCFLIFGANTYCSEWSQWTCSYGDVKLGRCGKPCPTSLGSSFTEISGEYSAFQCSEWRKNTCIMSMCGGCFMTFLALAIWLPLVSLIFLGKQCAARTIVQPSNWWLRAATMFVVSAVPSFTTKISLWKTFVSFLRTSLKSPSTNMAPSRTGSTKPTTNDIGTSEIDSKVILVGHEIVKLLWTSTGLV